MRFKPGDIYKKDNLPRFARRRSHGAESTAPGATQHTYQGRPGDAPGPPGSAAGRPLRKRRAKRTPIGARATMLVTSLLVGVMVLYIGLVAYTWIQKKRGKYSKPPTPPAAVIEPKAAPAPTPVRTNAVDIAAGPSAAARVAERITTWKSTRTLLKNIDDPAYVRDPDRAVAVLEEQLAKTPGYLALRLELAEKYYHRGEWAKAVEMQFSVLEQDPAERETRMRLAQSLLNLKDYEGAIGMARWILQEEPFSTDAHNILATSYLATDRVGDALPFLRKLVEGDRMNVAAHNNLGVAYTRLREFERAAEIFEKVIQISAENSVGYFNLAVCQAKLERVADSCATLRAAAKRFGAGFVNTWMRDREFDGIRGTLPFQRLTDEITREMGTTAGQAGTLLPGDLEKAETRDDSLILPRTPNVR